MSEHTTSAHEAPGVATGWVLMTAAGLFGLILLALALTTVLFAFSGDLRQSMERPPPVAARNGPQLQIDPAADLARAKARDEERLHSGARFPIAEAMRRIAGRSDPYAPLKRSETAGQP